MKREVSLDFVRGIAIFLACGSHFNAGTWRGENWLTDVLLFPGRAIGATGVDLFFVLSGYLVGGLMLREWATTGTFDGRRFLIRRAFKIWPVLYLFILLQLLANLRPWETYFFQVLFHVQNYLRTPLRHLWSLAVEEHFYLVFALAFTVWVSRKARTSQLPAVLIAVLLAEPLIRLSGHLLGEDKIGIQWETHYRLDSLALGILLVYWRTFEVERFERLLAARGWLWMVLGAAVVFLVFNESAFLRDFVGYSVAAAGGAATLLLSIGGIEGRNVLSRAMAAVGSYSYPLYVFHLAAARVTTAVWKKLALPPDSLWLLLGKYVSAICLAVLVAKVVERPVLMVRDRLFASKAVVTGPDKA